MCFSIFIYAYYTFYTIPYIEKFLKGNMVKKTNRHIYRCSVCLTPLSDEGEVMCFETGYIIINNATNVTPMPVVVVTTGLEMRPIRCIGCNNSVGFQFEKYLVFPPYQGKFVLERHMAILCSDMKSMEI